MSDPRTALLLAFILTSCEGQGLCDVGKYGLAIFGPPASIDRYHAFMSFEDQQFSIDCEEASAIWHLPTVWDDG